MKRFFLLALSAIILFLICSCATGTDISKKNKDGSPIWIKEIPTSSRFLYGVGKAKLMVDSNSLQAADAAARSDLANKINVNIKNALTTYSNEASAVVTSAFETIIVQSVNLTMKKVAVEQRWTADDGTVWSLVSFSVKDLPALYADAANNYLNQLEERRISTQERLIALLEELKDSTDSDSVALKTAAQEKADSIISEVMEIEGVLDVQEQMKELAKYLKTNGFELGE